MIQYFNTVNDKVTEVFAAEKGCWINVIAPSVEDLRTLSTEFDVPPVFLKSALDEEETSHIDNEDDMNLIIIDMPANEDTPNGVLYYTMPVSIIITTKYIITITTKDNDIITRFASGNVKGVKTDHRTRFVFQILLSVAARYLSDLKQIDKTSTTLEKNLRKSMRNKELVGMLDLQKSLVYFQTSLKSNELTLQKISTNRYIRLYDDDKELLEDVMIEIKQAIEMSGIYASILGNTLESCASIISNNLNVVMKILTSLTILMAIPTMIFSFYGMNLGEAAGGLPLAQNVWMPIFISLIVTGLCGWVLKRKGML
ncbi:MAG TPA: magnesium transporter CorA family protein [Clostridiales bacterium]|nr:magnesium transporter CorA family protein [Clostridiales bacterium]